MFNYYNGKPYAVASDGDYQVFVIRKDLWDSPKEQAAFRAKYGYALAPPKTWDQQADMAEFFHRPTDNLLGATDLRSPVWGWINFVTRYTSTGNPVAYYCDDNMKPLINGPGGLKALNHLIKTTQYGSKDALSWSWPEQYQNWGDGGAAMTIAFNNLTKFQKKGGPFDKSGFDVGSKTHAIPMPGWNVNGKLVRHTSLYFNASNGVNTFSPSKYHEAAYLFLQWVASGPIYTWLTANPGGYQDPCKVACLSDPLVRSSYTPRTVDVLGMTIPGATPSITGALKGANQYIQALDINLPEGALGPVVAAGGPGRGRCVVGQDHEQGRPCEADQGLARRQGGLAEACRLGERQGLGGDARTRLPPAWPGGAIFSMEITTDTTTQAGDSRPSGRRARCADEPAPAHLAPADPAGSGAAAPARAVSGRDGDLHQPDHLDADDRDPVVSRLPELDVVHELLGRPHLSQLSHGGGADDPDHRCRHRRRVRARIRPRTPLPRQVPRPAGRDRPLPRSR